MQDSKITDFIAATTVRGEMYPLDCPSRLVGTRSLENGGAWYRSEGRALESQVEGAGAAKGTHTISPQASSDPGEIHYYNLGKGMPIKSTVELTTKLMTNTPRNVSAAQWATAIFLTNENFFLDYFSIYGSGEFSVQSWHSCRRCYFIFKKYSTIYTLQEDLFIYLFSASLFAVILWKSGEFCF